MKLSHPYCPRKFDHYMPAEHLIADKGYDSDEIVRKAQEQNMQAQIPTRKNRKQQRQYDKHLCTASAIWWKTRLPTLNNGGALQHAMPKMLLPLLPLSISAAWSYG